MLVNLVVPLAVVCVFAVTAAFAAYYYSGMRSDLSYRAESTAAFFSDYIGLDYNDYYHSCAKYAETYEDRNHIELQFIDSSGELVVSSYGLWAGEAPRTDEIREAMETRSARPFVGADPVTGERIMAISAPLTWASTVCCPAIWWRLCHDF